MRIKILQTFNGNVFGESWRFHAGEVRDVPDGPAWEFINAHFAERLDEPAVKIVGHPEKSKRKPRIK